MFDLTGKVAVIVGGAGWLGSAVCRAMAQQGANVVVADIDQTRAAQLVDDLKATYPNAKHAAISFDVRDEKAIDDAISRLSADFGRLDILVAAAYPPHVGTLANITPDQFTASLAGTLTGAFMLARRAKAIMKSGGSMVFFSSMYGRVSPDPRVYHKPMEPNPIEYGVAKAGLDQMVRYLAVAWAPDGIRVNAVVPGPFPQANVLKNHPEFVARLAEKVPLGRVGKAEEVAGPVVFLCSDDASYVTGHTLVVDGGWTIW